MGRGRYAGVLGALLGLLGAAAAPAAVLYDNGPADGRSGVALDQGTIAQDFRLHGHARIEAVEVFGLQRFGSDSFQWQVHAGASTQPGRLLYAGVAVPARSVLGGTPGSLRLLWTLDLPDLLLPPGDYWLGLAGDVGTAWASAPANATRPGQRYDADPFDDPFVGWTTANPVVPEHAFRVLGTVGIPLPASAALLGLGLAALAVRRRSAAAQGSSCTSPSRATRRSASACSALRQAAKCASLSTSSQPTPQWRIAAMKSCA